MVDERTNQASRVAQVGLVAFLTVALALGALASPADARRAPKKRGPLSFDERACDRQTERWRNPKTGLTETVARTQTCVLFYRFDPLAESDEDRNYGVVWVQAKVDPRNGWCARSVTSKLLVTDDGKIHQRAPKKGQKVNARRQLRVKLATDANGMSDETGRLVETITEWPRRRRQALYKKDGSHVFRQRWTGLRGKPLLFASAVVISWADNPEDFPDALTSGLNYKFEKRGTCT